MTHLGCTRNPMSEARRQHINGPLLPARPEGEPSLLCGVLACALLIGAGWALVVAFS